MVYHTLGTLLFVARCFALVSFLLKPSRNSSLRLLFVQLFSKMDNNYVLFLAPQLRYYRIGESMKVKVLRAIFLHVILSVVCSRAVFCAGCRLAGCIVGGLVQLSRQNIARW